jgi:hypothetical protein
LSVVAVETPQVSDQPIGVAPVVGGIVGVGLREPRCQRGGDIGQLGGVLPDVRVAGEVGLRVPARLMTRVTERLAALGTPDRLGHLEDRAFGVLLDGGVDRGLEPLLVDAHVGGGDCGHLLRGELEIVRFGARAGEVGDVGVPARDPFGDVRERVEARDDRGTLAADGRAAAAAGEEAAGHCGAEQ